MPLDKFGSLVGSAGDLDSDGFQDVAVSCDHDDTEVRRTARTYVVFGREAGDHVIDTHLLNGENGVVLESFAGWSLTLQHFGPAGDINGDEVQDFLLGSRNFAGESYLIFGQAGKWPAVLNVSSLDGSMGFRMTFHSDELGSDRIAVSRAGDISGDGIDDILLGDVNNNFDGFLFAVFGSFFRQFTTPILHSLI